MSSRFIVGLLVLILAVSAFTAYKSITLSSLQDMQITISEDQSVETRETSDPAYLTKTVNGTEVRFCCSRQPGEDAEEFGRRCRREFKAWCKGFEDDED